MTFKKICDKWLPTFIGVILMTGGLMNLIFGYYVALYQTMSIWLWSILLYGGTLGAMYLAITAFAFEGSKQ